MIRSQDLAYMAGLVDMRCTVNLSPDRGGRQRLYIRAVVTKMPTVAEFLQKMVGGGCVSTNARNDSDRRPCAVHCDHKHQSIAGSVSYQFALYGVRAAVVLFNLEPYLMRWDDYQKAFTHFRSHVDDLDKIKTRATVASLAALGWEIPDWLQL